MPFLTAKDVSVELNIPLARVYELTRLGQLPVVPLGKRQLRYDLDTLRRWIEQAGRVESSNQTGEQAKVRDGNK